MKCEGEANNCIRCQKAGRACLPQVTPQRPTFKAHLPGPQTQLQGSTPNSCFESAPRVYDKPPTSATAEREPPSRVDVKPAGFDNYQRSYVPPGRITTNYGPQHDQRTSWSNSAHLSPSQNDTIGELPSIFSTPPVDTVTGRASPTMTPKPFDGKPSSFGRKRKRLTRPGAEIEDLLTPANSQRSEDMPPITKKDMRDMVHLFYERHLPFMPCLPPEEFRDIDHLIETELPFVYAICYVTARYLLGGQEIREKLLPEISRIPKRLFLTQIGGLQQDELCTFKALCVLCHYSDLTPISEASQSTEKEDVLYWPLKSLAEIYGLRMSLHRSVQEVKSELASKPTGIVESKSFARYVYWLWLYDTANL